MISTNKSQYLIELTNQTIVFGSITYLVYYKPLLMVQVDIFLLARWTQIVTMINCNIVINARHTLRLYI